MEISPEERRRRDEVIQRVIDHVNAGQAVKLPPFDPSLARPNDRFALINVGLEPNDFSGLAGGLRYQFEGEEDLLHLIVTADGGPVSVEAAQHVAGFVLQGVPKALVWLRPGELSQHFYLGHDDLVANIEKTLA